MGEAMNPFSDCNIPKVVQDELDSCEFPWEIKEGKRHFKLVIAGKMACVISRGSTPLKYRRDLNMRQTVRMALRELRDKQNSQPMEKNNG